MGRPLPLILNLGPSATCAGCRQPVFHTDSRVGDPDALRLVQPIQNALADFPGFEWQVAEPSTPEQLLLVHPVAHVRSVLADPAAAPAEVSRTDVQASTVPAAQKHAALLEVGAAVDALTAIRRDGYFIASTLAGGNHHVPGEGGPATAPFNDLAVAAGTGSHSEGRLCAVVWLTLALANKFHMPRTSGRDFTVRHTARADMRLGRRAGARDRGHLPERTAGRDLLHARHPVHDGAVYGRGLAVPRGGGTARGIRRCRRRQHYHWRAQHL